MTEEYEIAIKMGVLRMQCLGNPPVSDLQEINMLQCFDGEIVILLYAKKEFTNAINSINWWVAFIGNEWKWIFYDKFSQIWYLWKRWSNEPVGCNII